MDTTQTIITAGVGLLGIGVGTIARPYFEDWFARQKKTLHVVVQESSEFRSPHSSVEMNWHGHAAQRLVQTGFKLENRTGRTLRNFRLEIGAAFVGDDSQIHAVYLEEQARVRFTSDDDGLRTQFRFELMEPGAVVPGSMMSNYPVALDIVALDEIELRRVAPRSSGGFMRYFAGAATAAGLSMVATAALGG